MTFSEIRQILCRAFSTEIRGSDELRAAIAEKRAAGDRLMLVGANITAAIDGHNDIYRSVVEATDKAGAFK